jgi:hypothetical protein
MSDMILIFILGLGTGSISTLAFVFYIATRIKSVPESEALKEANREIF